MTRGSTRNLEHFEALRASVAPHNSVCFDHIFRHMESIWTICESRLITSMKFAYPRGWEGRGKENSIRRHESAETQDRARMCKILVEIFKSQRGGARRSWEVCSRVCSLTSSADRYLTRILPAITFAHARRFCHRRSRRCGSNCVGRPWAVVIITDSIAC